MRAASILLLLVFLAACSKPFDPQNASRDDLEIQFDGGR